jgi:hypothetical protein
MSFSEPVSWNGGPDDSQCCPIQEEVNPLESDREERWARFEGECLDFAKSEPDGFAAVLRAVARAIKQQKELPL